MKKFSELLSITFLIQILFFSGAILCYSRFANAQFSLSAELRPRLEFRDGYRTLPTEDSKPAAFVSQRSRLITSYTAKKFSLKVSLQDVRTWGDEGQTQNVPSLALHEAYGQVQFSDKSMLRIGRQELVYDDERLLGNSSWGQAARSHDAALFRFTNSGFSVDAAAAFNQTAQNLEGTYYALNNYKVLGFVRAGKTVDNKYKAYGLFITDGFQGTDSTKSMYMRYTYGTTGEYDVHDFVLKGMFYGQSGNDPTNHGISAYMFSLQGYYLVKSFTGGIGVDFLSGNDGTDDADDKVKVFNTLYATNHPLYGHIDYFENIAPDTKNGGLMDGYVKLKYSFKKVGAYLDYHYFALSGKVADPENADEAISSYLGSEIDLWLNYKIIDGLEFRPGFSTMMATESMDVIKGGNKELNGMWAYLQLTFNPTIFKSEPK